MSALRSLATRARRRWWRLAIARSGVAALAAGLAVPIVAGAASSLGVTHLNALSRDVLAAGLAAALAAAAIAVVVSVRRAPSLLDVARWLDRDADLDERLSTALEVEGTPSAASLVARAAIEDANAHVGRARIDSAVPWRWPRWGMALSIGLLTGVTVVIAVPQPSTERPASVTTSVDDDTASAILERTGATVDRIARVLADDPARAEDAYVRAVADAFDDLSERIRGGELDEEGAQRALDQLLSHLLRAVEGRDDDAIATLVTNYLDSGRAHDDGTRPADATNDGAADPGDAPAAERRSEPGTAAPSLEQMLADLERALDEAERVASDRPPAAVVSDDAAGDFFYGVDLSQLSERQPGGLVQEGEGAGTPVGAAELSDDRPGDAAGDGLQGESPDGPPVSLGDVDASDDVLVATDEIEGGRRVTVETDPTASSGPRSGGASLDAPLPAHRADEAAIARESFATAYAAVVSAYFTPDQREQRTEP